MKAYLVSLAVGLLVGLAYGVSGVRSPAPPIVALIGLLGMLVGEQMAPMVKRLVLGGAGVQQAAPVVGRSTVKPIDADGRG
jgi:XapX domain-containing protein